MTEREREREKERERERYKNQNTQHEFGYKATKHTVLEMSKKG